MYIYEISSKYVQEGPSVDFVALKLQRQPVLGRRPSPHLPLPPLFSLSRMKHLNTPEKKQNIRP